MILSLLLASTVAAGDAMRELNWEDPAHILAELEASGIETGLRAWDDQEVIAKLAEKEITEDLIRGLYYDFKNVVIDPPDPYAHTEYTIDDKEESLGDAEALGRLLHNLYRSLSEKDSKKYGTLIGLMRAVLYVDIKHIPFALKNDDSRDFLWYEAHAKGVRAVDKEYAGIFKD